MIGSVTSTVAQPLGHACVKVPDIGYETYLIGQNRAGGCKKFQSFFLGKIGCSHQKESIYALRPAQLKLRME